MDLESRDLDMQFGNDANPFVAIWMVTYNHETFIEQAIESVMMQQATFNYKLFIGEDYSKDNTRKICKDLKEKYPDKIKLFLNSENLGGILNAKQIYESCFESDAKYIALLEGDDYWTDSLKLQKQVDILEKNNDCSLCFTNNSKLLPNGEILLPQNKITKQKSCFEDLIKGNYISTLTVLFRNNNLYNLPNWFSNLPIGDWPLYLWLLRNGEKAYYLKDNTAVYRTNVGIFRYISKTNSNIFRTLIYVLETIKDDKEFVIYKVEINESLTKHKVSLMGRLIREGNLLESVNLYFHLIKFTNILSITNIYLFTLIKKIIKRSWLY